MYTIELTGARRSGTVARRRRRCNETVARTRGVAHFLWTLRMGIETLIFLHIFGRMNGVARVVRKTARVGHVATQVHVPVVAPARSP